MVEKASTQQSGPPAVRLSSPGERERHNADGHVRSPTISLAQTFQIKWEVYFSKEVFARLYSMRQYVFCMYMCIYAYLLCGNKTLGADIITSKKHWFDVSSLKNAFFTARVPNYHHCACLSNQFLSYKWVASILRHPVVQKCFSSNNISHLFSSFLKIYCFHIFDSGNLILIMESVMLGDCVNESSTHENCNSSDTISQWNDAKCKL